MYKNLGKRKLINLLKNEVQLSDRNHFEYLSCPSMERVSAESADGTIIKLVHLEIDHEKGFFYIDSAGRTLKKWEDDEK
ncbi:MAG: hypothetical protein PUB28_12705 [Roseburia sp.]|nr:hypothetical protein [Roseburia sp.]